MHSLILALCLLAPPTLDVPSETPVYVPVVVKLKDAGKGIKARFKVTPAPAWQENHGTYTRFTGPPGKYRVAVLFVDFDAKEFDELEGVTSIVGDAPKPPDPEPPSPVSPLPRPSGFAGEVYDQAIAVGDLKNAAALGRAIDQYAKQLNDGADLASIPTTFSAAVRAVGLPATWRPFGQWLLGQLQVRAPNVPTARQALTEAAIGLLAAGGVQ